MSEIHTPGRHVHRLTPLLEFWTLLLALATIFVLNLSAETFETVWEFATQDGAQGAGIGLAILLGGFALICLLLWWGSGLWWKAKVFTVTDEDVSLRHGVLSKQLRSARYDRIQAVDVAESVIARIFGLASVRIETAGGQSSAIEIKYLPKAEANALRTEVLGKVRGMRATDPNALADAPEPGTAEPLNTEPGEGLPPALTEHPGEVVLEEIPIARTLAGAAMNIGTLLTVGFLIAIVVTPVPLSTALPFLVGAVPSVWGLVDKSWRFNARLAVDPNSGEEVLAIKYGLADRRAQSIRLDRIHAVRVYQPVLWRFRDWWAVKVTVAGYGNEGGGKGSGSTLVVPVGTREQAVRMLELVSELSFDEIEAYARPEGHTNPTYTSPKNAFWVSPIDRDQQAVSFVEHGVNDIVVTHSGRLSRQVNVIEPSHIQELTFAQGPIAHLCKVANVRMDLVKGPVQMTGRDLSPDDAADLLARLRTRRLPDYHGRWTPTEETRR